MSYGSIESRDVSLYRRVDQRRLIAIETYRQFTQGESERNREWEGEGEQGREGRGRAFRRGRIANDPSKFKLLLQLLL